MKTTNARTRREKVIIVGAGVAGLSLAIHLAQRKVESEVLESRRTFDGSTSGVRITAEGVKILKSMNVDSIGESTGKVAMRFGAMSVSFASPRQDASAIIVTRVALHEKLMEQANSLGVRVMTGFKAASVVESEDGVEVTSEAGEKAIGTLLVGADGVGSFIRQMLNTGQGSTKIYAGYLGVGFLTEDEAKIEMTLHRYPGHQVGIASCGRVNAAAVKKSIFMWTHIHMPEKEARMATKASVEAELAKRSASWRPELRSKYDLYTKDHNAMMAYGPVYNGKPPPVWFSDTMILSGDAAHPYGPGGQGISMALKDAKALSEVIVRGFTEDEKREFQRIRAQESRTLGEAAEKRNAKELPSTWWGVFAEGVLMKTVEIFTRGTLRF
jgi:2-polyprenyl-6-methoxyphenol hydroxylase-like FAD-dependent oxidoreductase